MAEILQLLVYPTLALILVLAIWYWPKYKYSTQRYFLLFVIFIVITEILGNFFEEMTGLKDFCIYNIFSLVSLSFYHYWFYQILRHKKICLAVSAIFVLSAIASMLTESFFNGLWTYILCGGNVSLIVLSLLFYSDLLKSNDSITYYTAPTFWFTTGIFIFNIGFVPVAFFQDLISQERLEYRLVLTALNLIQYGSFGLGFINSKNG